jgi:ribosomal-protein-alanine N-acetyltransferase
MLKTSQEVRVSLVSIHAGYFPEVLRIEADSFEFPWSEGDFIRCLKQRNCVGKVAVLEGRVLGYVVYEYLKSSVHLLNIAVDAECRGGVVGTQMIAELTDKLRGNRTRIVAEVRETNLPAQLFFRANGFRAVAVLRGFYDDTPEDAYQMVYRLPRRRP